MSVNKPGNAERMDRIRQGLQQAGLDACICSLPTDVLLLSGYWPVIGTSVAIATQDGRVIVIIPADEQELAEQGWAEVKTMPSAALNQMPDLLSTLQSTLTPVLQALGLDRGRIGFEGSAMSQPVPYAALNVYGTTLPDLLRQAFPHSRLTDASQFLIALRSVMTPAETEHVKAACEVAEAAFQFAADQLKPGLRETEIAAACEGQLSIQGIGYKGAQRAGGFAFCMSGPNSALAGRAYAQSRSRALESGDLVLLHVNSYRDGYWTDITRTYCLGEPTLRQRSLYEAIFEARAAALAAIRPGVKAAEVDRAARRVLEKCGFADYFTHSTGHNVGFSAISGSSPPRLHPASPDVLETGMVFNVEPAIYIQGFGGIRHCDVVTVTGDGVQVLTPFQPSIDHLIH